MQQAPVGALVVQLVVVQTVPKPRHVPWASAHAASVVSVQVAPPLGFATQHAPLVVPGWAKAELEKPIATAQHSAAALPLTISRARDENTMGNLLDPLESFLLHAPQARTPNQPKRPWLRYQ